MSRAHRTLAAGIASITLLTACGARRERAILDAFFAASRLRDKTALVRISTVIFEPLEQGIVVHYDIANVATEGNTKRVSIDAQVRRADGRVVPERLVVLLEGRDGRWIVTGVTQY